MNQILIVDDSASVRQQVGFTLRSVGFTIAEAIDGTDGLEQLKKNAAIGLVICDVNMPRMSGLEMIESVREQGLRPGLPIVMLTTEGQTALVERAKKAGAKGWIVKPFKPELLIAAVKKLVGAA
jgi:two-component system chemotaxis response regulator CheY